MPERKIRADRGANKADGVSPLDVEQIANWLKILVEPDSTVELRILFESAAPLIRHFSSNDLLKLAKDAVRLGQGAKGVYFLLNPLPAKWSGSPATDADIVRRRRLLIDCDPKRKGSVSATDDEKDAARQRMVEVDAFLDEQGWPAPIIADSGNGWHLIYWIDLPADDDGLVVRIIKALAARFSDEVVEVDTKVGNASRVCKLYGSVAAKGENTADRPHRVSKIITIPATLDVVPIELLQRLANESEKPQQEPVLNIARTGDAGHASRSEAMEQARKYLAAMERSIEGQHGSDRLIKAASVMVNDFRLTDGEAFDLLMVEFNPQCQPPWSENDIRRKINEAKKNPPSRPPKGPGTATRSARTGQSQNFLSEAIVHRLRDVQPEQVEWLWPNRIPLGKLTLLAGDPGLGKSFVTCDLAARVSRGAVWPDDSTNQQVVGSVVIFNCEDGLADTIRPRLDRAGADVTKIVAIEGIKVFDPETGEARQRGFTLANDLPRLEIVVRDLADCRLVVIDPISGFLGDTDSHKNADVRALLAPLKELAERYHVAILMINHLSKGDGVKAIYRSMGSLAFAAAARAVWHFAKCPNDEARRLILPAKMNLAPDPTGLAYRIEQGAICWEADPVRMNADELLAIEAAIKPDSDRSQRDDAADWLRETLANGPMPSKDIIADGHEHGHSDKTLRRAYKELGGKPIKTGMDGGWVWSLPAGVPSPDANAVQYLADLDPASLFPPLAAEGGHAPPKMPTP